MKTLKGFTLLEVLIALAIVAIGLGAALRASGVGTEGLRDYRARTLAIWLTENAIAEQMGRRAWPAPGEIAREETMAGQHFKIREVVKTTPNPYFRRLEIDVSATDNPGYSLHHAVAFITQP